MSTVFLKSLQELAKSAPGKKIMDETSSSSKIAVPTVASTIGRYIPAPASSSSSAPAPLPVSEEVEEDKKKSEKVPTKTTFSNFSGW